MNEHIKDIYLGILIVPHDNIRLINFYYSLVKIKDIQMIDRRYEQKRGLPYCYINFHGLHDVEKKKRDAKKVQKVSLWQRFIHLRDLW